MMDYTHIKPLCPYMPSPSHIIEALQILERATWKMRAAKGTGYGKPARICATMIDEEHFWAENLLFVYSLCPYVYSAHDMLRTLVGD